MAGLCAEELSSRINKGNSEHRKLSKVSRKYPILLILDGNSEIDAHW